MIAKPLQFYINIMNFEIKINRSKIKLEEKNNQFETNYSVRTYIENGDNYH